MDFMEKVGNNNKVLNFLTGYGFEENGKCGYGCCKGYYKGFYSGNKLYYNRVTIWVKEGYVYVSSHKEYDVGGHLGTAGAGIKLSEATENDVLKLINEVLPDDLD